MSSMTWWTSGDLTTLHTRPWVSKNLLSYIRSLYEKKGLFQSCTEEEREVEKYDTYFQNQ